jgi:solute carrier family 25 phosphate transporter 3
MSSATSTGATKVEAAKPVQLSGAQLYSRFALAGAICCSVTHGALTPVDVYVPSPDSLHALRCEVCDTRRGS